MQCLEAIPLCITTLLATQRQLWSGYDPLSLSMHFVDDTTMGPGHEISPETNKFFSISQNLKVSILNFSFK